MDRFLSFCLALFCVWSAPDWLVPSGLAGLFPGIGLFVLVRFFAGIVLATLFHDPESYEQMSPESRLFLYRLAEQHDERVRSSRDHSAHEAL